MMPQMMNSFNLLSEGRIRGKAFPFVTAIAVVVTFTVGSAALLWVIYRWAAIALSEWPITVYPAWVFGELEASIHSPEQVSNPFRLALLAGAAFTWLLIWVSTRFLCWVSATAHGAARPMRYFVRTLPARGDLLYRVEGCGRLESKKQ